MKIAQYFFALLLIFAVTAGCKNDSNAKNAARGGKSQGPRALTVRTAGVQTRNVVYKIQALGSLEAEELVQVPAQVGGAVTEVLFNEGDRVTADTVLVRIDPDRYRLQAEQAEAAYRKATADWKRADADSKRREELAQQQLVAAEELNRAQLEAERLAAEMASAKASLDLSLQNSRRSEVRAPRPGVINTRNVSTGQFVQTGTVLATLVDPGRLRLRFKVSENESLSAKTGETVTFRVAALGSREFQAKVYHVGDIADPQTRQVEVLGWVKNPGALKPGFFAEVTLVTQEHKQALVVPESAVQASEQGFVAYVVENGIARVHPLQIGLRSGDGSVEITSGLQPGEQVVVEGSDRLADGMAVQAAAELPGGERK